MTQLVARTRLHAGVLAASMLLHFVVLRSLSVQTGRVDSANPEPTSVDFEASEPGASHASEPAAAGAEEVPPVRLNPGKRAAYTDQRTDHPTVTTRSAAARSGGRAVPGTATPEAPTRPELAFSESNSGGGQAPPLPRHPFDIDPRSAVLSMMIDPESPGSGSTQAGDLASSRGAELSAALKTRGDDTLRRQHRALALVHNDDGSFSYAGEAISGTILPDGSVRFEDKPVDVRVGVLQSLDTTDGTARSGRLEPLRPSRAAEAAASQQPFAGIRITGRSWAAERSWFLRETASLRAELADAAHARELAGAEHALRKQLDRIWSDTTVAPADRRREMFALWDSTSGDEVGARGRRAIEQYVRENLSCDGAFAFPATQLAELNSTRTQEERFDPYSAATGCDPGVGESP